MLKNIMKSLMIPTIYALLFTGCAIPKNLLRAGIYQKELLPHHQIYVSQIWAEEDKGELKVAGRLRPRGIMGGDIPDYVEVALVDHSGTVIAAQKVAYYPGHLTGRKHSREASFSTRFSQLPPAGATVRVRHVN